MNYQTLFVDAIKPCKSFPERPLHFQSLAVTVGRRSTEHVRLARLSTVGANFDRTPTGFMRLVDVNPSYEATCETT